MALLIFDQSKCTLCGKPITKNEPVCSFPAFVTNELDPCLAFSDGAFHEACVLKHEDGPRAISRADEWGANTGPGKRKCAVCKKEITDHNDYLLVEHLSDDDNNGLKAFNYTHLHKSCIPNWKDRLTFIDLINAANTSNLWEGPYLGQLISAIGQFDA
jgi:predicted nucleic acid-binding Zn ribbon protein